MTDDGRKTLVAAALVAITKLTEPMARAVKVTMRCEVCSTREKIAFKRLLSGPVRCSCFGRMWYEERGVSDEAWRARIRLLKLAESDGEPDA